MNIDERDTVEEIRKEARRLEEDAEHSMANHYAAANIWGYCNLWWLGLPATILAAASGVISIADWKLTSASIAFLVALLSGLQTLLKPNQRESSHTQAGHSFNSLRSDTRVFANITCAQGGSIGELRQELFELGERRKSLNIESPHIFPWARRRGFESVKRGDTTHKVDK